MTSPTTAPPAALAELVQQIRAEFLRRDFGAIWFWRFAVVRPHDQGQHLVDCTTEGRGADAHLCLHLQHASGQGHIAKLAIWQPEGLSISPQGLSLARAAKLHFGPAEAWPDPAPDAAGRYRVRTAQGEGGFPMEDAAALFLQI